MPASGGFYDTDARLNKAYEADVSKAMKHMEQMWAFRTGKYGMLEDLRAPVHRHYRVLRAAFRMYACRGTGTYHLFMNGFYLLCKVSRQSQISNLNSRTGISNLESRI